MIQIAILVLGATLAGKFVCPYCERELLAIDRAIHLAEHERTAAMIDPFLCEHPQDLRLEIKASEANISSPNRCR